MISLSLADCANILEASTAELDSAATFTGISIDTRTLEPGNLYAAVRGEQHDGHDFSTAAAAAGAAALLVEHPVVGDMPQIVVTDTRAALGRLARTWLARHSLPVIAVTGSNGKTTVKEMLARILGEVGPVLATRGNLNNELGVPLTLFRLSAEHRFAVIEMGANHRGEIRQLAKIAPPDVALITGIAGVHLEGFGSLEGVALGKSELFEALSPDGLAVINADDRQVATLRRAAGHCRRLEFGRGPRVDFQLGDGPGLRFEPRDDAAIDIPAFTLLGEHNRTNALAASATAHALGIPASAIAAGLGAMRAVSGRLELKQGIGGSTLIDDSYNANPESARAGIDVLAARPGHRHLVLGDMGELGAEASALHRSVGAHARAAGLDGLWSTGTLAADAQRGFGASRSVGGHFDTRESLADALIPCLQRDWTVLIKGSRSSRMNEVVEALESPHESGAERVAPQESDA